MSLHYDVSKGQGTHLLVAIHGLMGNAGELQFLEEISDEFKILYLDFHAKASSVAFKSSNDQAVMEIDYDSGAEEIKKVLELSFAGQSAFFFGSSIGGKIVYDFMAQFPDLYLGSVITDMSPAPLEDAEFYQLFNRVMPLLDLTKPWGEVRKEIKQLIPDRNARILVSSQIYYPNGGQKGEWREGVKSLDEKILGLRINNQWKDFERIWQQNSKKSNQILIAPELSSISASTRSRLQETEAFELVEVPGGSHFLHVTHKELICEALKSMLSS